MTSHEPVHAVVFDMDGLLLDTTPVLVTAYTMTVEQITGRRITPDELFGVWHHGTSRMTLPPLIGRTPAEDELRQHTANFRTLLHQLRPYEGIVEMVHEIATQVPVGVFTAAAREYAMRCLEETGLWQYFDDDQLIANEDVTHQKPDGQGLVMLANRWQLPTESLIYIGDALNDVLAARHAGALAVAGRWGHYFSEDHPADVICDTPGDLVVLLEKRAFQG